MIILTISIAISLSGFYRNPGNLMMPTIKAGDYVFVFKNPNHEDDYLPLEHGDVITFKSQSNGYEYLRRIIAMEGDKLEIINNEFYINDEALYREYVEDFTSVSCCELDKPTAAKYMEYSATGRGYYIIDIPDNPNNYYVQSIIVPKGQYVVTIDKRNYLPDILINKVKFIKENQITSQVITVLSKDDNGEMQFKYLYATEDE